jgi:addiction module HigA family antidote
MEPDNITATDLSKRLDINYHSLSNILSGKGSITPDIALKLQKIFSHTTVEYWLNLQTAYDVWYAEGNLGTDEPFYQLMTFGGEAILKLIGASNCEGYDAKAVVLKEKSLYPDIMAIPKDPDKERIFIEFQAYTETMIRHITASKVAMSCAQDQYTGSVLAAIIYTDQKFQDNASAFSIKSDSGESFFKGQFKEIVLSNYTEEKLIEIDPRLVILVPFTLTHKTSKTELAQKCNKWKTIAVEVYPESVNRNVLNVFSLFILNRFKNISIKEVRAMLNFDLSDTRAGEELIDMGRVEGRLEGRQELLYTQLFNRFGSGLPVNRETLVDIDDTVINSLSNAIFDFKTADDVVLWWRMNANGKNENR